MTLNMTNAGLNILLRALAGARIVFTRVQIGNGEAQTSATAEALSNPLLELPIQAIEVSVANVTLQTKFNNNTVEAGFRHTETGIWVQSQDDDTQEVLYAYGTQPEATADYISASGDNILETQMDFLVFVGESQNISAIISESLVYASAADLKAHIDNKQNPHGVTAEQVGLGSVPNVPTNGQTPTYAIPGSLAALISGEKLGTAMGKIARAVLNLIEHLKNNVAHVTAEERNTWNNKAAGSHNHSATDINNGILGVARGGTGKSSWTANRLLYPTSASNIGQMAAPSQDEMYLCQNQTGAPFWKKIVPPTVPPTSESGTYVGGGKTGSNARNSITFQNGLPKLVFIKQSNMLRWGVLCLSSNTATGFSVIDNGTQSALIVSTSGNTVSWYYDSADSHPANQLDHYGNTFVYVGIF